MIVMAKPQLKRGRGRPPKNTDMHKTTVQVRLRSYLIPLLDALAEEHRHGRFHEVHIAIEDHLARHGKLPGREGHK